jgi:hypothetical protein
LWLCWRSNIKRASSGLRKIRNSQNDWDKRTRFYRDPCVWLGLGENFAKRRHHFTSLQQNLFKTSQKFVFLAMLLNGFFSLNNVIRIDLDFFFEHKHFSKEDQSLEATTTTLQKTQTIQKVQKCLGLGWYIVLRWSWSQGKGWQPEVTPLTEYNEAILHLQYKHRTMSVAEQAKFVSNTMGPRITNRPTFWNPNGHIILLVVL